MLRIACLTPKGPRLRQISGDFRRLRMAPLGLRLAGMRRKRAFHSFNCGPSATATCRWPLILPVLAPPRLSIHSTWSFTNLGIGSTLDPSTGFGSDPSISLSRVASGQFVNNSSEQGTFEIPRHDPWDCHRTAAPLTPTSTSPGRFEGSPDRGRPRQVVCGIDSLARRSTELGSQT